MKEKQTITIAIDPGSKTSGIVVLKNTEIVLSKVAYNAEVIKIAKRYKLVGFKVRAVIEVIKPYHGYIRPETITTCEWIGALKHCLKTSRIAFKEYSRSEVRKWVFDKFPQVCIPAINDKNLKKRKINKDGKLRTPSFHSVDDSIVSSAMRFYLGIKEEDKFKKNKHGLSSHCWQSLALGLFYEDIKIQS